MAESTESPIPAPVSGKPDPHDAPAGNETQPGGTDEDVQPSTGAAAVDADPLTESKAEAARLRDQLLRTAADFDNYRKRTRRESVEAEQRGREAFLKEILPVFDNLERAVSHAEVATDIQSLLNGIQMVKRQFTDTLARQGIERVVTVGAQFDPAVHEAIQHLETDDQPPGTVANEIQGGYIVHKRLIRPALVVVAKAKTASDTIAQGDAKASDEAKRVGAEHPGDEGTVTFDEPEIVNDTVEDSDAENNRN